MRYSRDAGYVWDMLNAARRIVRCVEGLDLEQYTSLELNKLATERLLGILGEAAKRVSDGFKQANPDVP
jgi:uncharacterized protein with HEPN domain